MLEHVFHQVAALLALCAVVGAAATRLRQPLMVGFLAAGILVGPEALGLVDETEELELLATIGIALLLFVVGLRLDLRLVRSIGPVALATGMGQILATAVLGFGLSLGLGMPTLAALYVAAALTFSSTVIIVKLLADKGEIDELHGRIAIGILIVQDLVVVVVMIALSAFGDTAQGGVLSALVEVVARGVAFGAGILVLARWVLPPMLGWLARSPELLALFAVAWAVLLAAAGDLLGFSEEVGAFLAGVSLASTPYREALGARLVGLRDFLLLFFFIVLGVRFDLDAVGDQLVTAAVLSAFVLLAKPLIILALMGWQGYRARVSFRTGITLAQISEFSLILAALGLGLGHIGEDTVGLITLVALVTIGLSTYLITASGRLYARLAPALSAFERRGARDHTFADDDKTEADVAVVGLGRYGGEIVTALSEAGHQPMGIDFDPRALRAWDKRGLPVLYGDADDPELPQLLPLSSLRWVVSSARSLDTNLGLIQALAQAGYSGRVAATAMSSQDAQALRKAGADAVLLPFATAAREAVSLLSRQGL